MSVRVLSVVVALLFFASCAGSAPSVPPAGVMCEWLPESSGLWVATRHFESSYPQQAAELSSTPGDWITESTDSSVVFWNTVTGFRWEAKLGWRQVSLGADCVGTMPEAHVIKATVTTVVPTIVPNLTHGPGD